MDSVAVTVPLRPPMKKMKKRKELDALAPSHVVPRRTSGKRSSQELLTDSSDERSEYWNVSIRGNRKGRARRTRACPNLLRACSAFFGCVSVLATASLIWLFIDVRQQLTSLRIEVDQAIAGSEGVPDALQKCHSLSKELQNNQTILFTQLADVKLQITNFTIQLTDIQQSLPQVQELLTRAPELSNVFKDLKDIRNSVAEFGSRIQDLRNTAESFKAVDNKLQDAQVVLQNNITDIKSAVTELSKVTQPPEVLTNTSKLKTEELSQAISKLKTDLSSANKTLTSSLIWVQDDQKKYKKTLDDLQDKTMNVEMRLESLKGECAKVSEQESIIASVKNLTKEVTNARTLEIDLSGRVNQLEQNYSRLKNSTDVILNSINDAKTSNTKSSEETTVKSEPLRP